MSNPKFCFVNHCVQFGKVIPNAFQEAGLMFLGSKPFNVIIKEEYPVIEANNKEKGNLRKNFKILIAEDDETSDFLLIMMIKKFYNKIMIVRNGNDAVEACREIQDIDLVLMDIKMPNINGYEATRQIRQFNKSVVIIAQTAHALAGDREKALEAGCNDYITKPIAKNVLIEMIRNHCKVKG